MKSLKIVRLQEVKERQDMSGTVPTRKKIQKLKSAKHRTCHHGFGVSGKLLNYV